MLKEPIPRARSQNNEELRDSMCLDVSVLAVASRISSFGRENAAGKDQGRGHPSRRGQSDEIELPAEFQIALYENLVRQLEKKGFAHVYRDSDRNAANIADLVVLRSVVRGFKAGSERTRQVTTFAGATSITVHCSFTTRDGQVLLEQDVNGKVRFFGGNLRATHDFAKKASKIAEQNLSISSGS